jgi:hypothetical protein
MPAGYATSTASSPTDLLQKLVAWLVTQGYTTDYSAVDGTGWRAHSHKVGTSVFVHMRAAMNETVWNYQSGAGYGLGLYLSDGFTGSGTSWRAQGTATTGFPTYTGTANAVGVGMSLPNGAMTYYFFDDGLDNITVVVDRGAGIYTHMGWGTTLQKIGFSSDYWYFYGAVPSYYNNTKTGNIAGFDLTAYGPMTMGVQPSAYYCSITFVRVDAAVWSNRWVSFNGNSGVSETGNTGRVGRPIWDPSQAADSFSTEHPNIKYLFGRGYQTSFVGGLLFPTYVFCQAVSARWIPIGYAPSVFHFNGVGHGFNPATVYAVGGVNYMMFPNFAVRKAA